MRRWHFPKRGPADEVAEPIQEEFFDEATDPDERRRGPAATLVREAIQNSLDARADPRVAVHVRFYLSDPDALSAGRACAWFASLWPHLRARNSGLRRVPSSPGSAGFVLIEDFGTRGLEGDTERWQTPDEGEQDDFFAFFRANGLSGKAGSEGGRWGVGKSVFARASRINTFMALTVRRSDRRALVIGRCFLRTHKIDGDEFQPYGRYGHVRDDGFVLPVKDADVLQDFCRDFRLARDLETPGLSIVVPYADEEIAAEDIVAAVVQEYFYPVLCGQLTVDVAGHGLPGGRKTLRIDAESLPVILEQHPVNGLDGLIELAQWARRQNPAAMTVLHMPPVGEPPRWSADLFPEEVLEFLEERFRHNEPIAVRVPVRVERHDRRPEASYFDVFLRRDAAGQGYRPVFVRSGIIIPEALRRRVKGHHLHALVVIDHGALASMLGDAETPAHNRWSPDTRHFRDRYEHGRAVLEFVTGAPRQIAEILSRARDERDVLLLADIFPAPPEEDEQAVPDPGPRPGRETERTRVSVEQRNLQPFRVEQIDGGFRVTRDHPDETALPEAIAVRVAYDTERGDPLRRYHPADFDLSKSPISVTCFGADHDVNQNMLRIYPTDEDFEVRVTGFDPNRDLYIQAEVISEPVRAEEHDG